MEYRKYEPERIFRHIISMPFIYMMIVPLVIFDIFLEIYHRVCFPLYGLPYVKRLEYIKIDRHKLKYLRLLDRFNCAYCGYGNGLTRYASRIAAETERYWCSIKHENNPERVFRAPEHHKDFLAFGDEEEFKKFIKK